MVSSFKDWKYLERPHEEPNKEYYVCTPDSTIQKQKLYVNWFTIPMGLLENRCSRRIVFWDLLRRDNRINPNDFVFDDENTVWSCKSFKQFETSKIVYENNKQVRYLLKIEKICGFCLQFSTKDSIDQEKVDRSHKFLKYLFTQKFRYYPDQNRERRITQFVNKFANDKNAIFHIPQNCEPEVEIGPNIQPWIGIHMAIRELSNGDPVINFGLTHKCFYRFPVPNMTLLDYFITVALSLSTNAALEQTKKKIDNGSYSMNEWQRDQATELLGGLRVKCNHIWDGEKSKYLSRHLTVVKISSLSSFKDILPYPFYPDRNRICYEKLFRYQGNPLRYPNLPMVLCKVGKIEVLLPLEKVFLNETPQRFKKHLDFNMRTNLCRVGQINCGKIYSDYCNLLKEYLRPNFYIYPKCWSRYDQLHFFAATHDPHVHKQLTEEMLAEFQFFSDENNFLKNFDISPDLQMIECEGKVLKPANLVDGENNPILMNENRSFRFNKLNVVPNKVLEIVMIVLREDGEGRKQPLSEETLVKFYGIFINLCAEKGLKIDEGNKSLFIMYKNIPCFEGPNSFRAAVGNAVMRFEQVDNHENHQLLFLVINHPSFNVYGHIKDICDNVYGVANQVINVDTILRAVQNTPSEKPFMSIIDNIIIQLNAKLGGVNQEIDYSEKSLSGKEVAIRNQEPLKMYVGIDVTHPSPGSGIDYSIASIVASMNREGTRYRNKIVAQVEIARIVSQGRLVKERTDILRGKFISLLEMFFEQNGDKLPDHIIVFRDGVSDSELLPVSYDELYSLRCEVRNFIKMRGLEQKEPMYTYIFVQKRHKTRFYRVSDEDDDEGQKKKSSEVKNNSGIEQAKSGTVVDTHVVSSFKFDFWLASQHGPLGTTRPAHYTVMHDDSRMPKEEIYKMCYDFCFLSFRCRKPTSLPAPLHYAHLSCEKAKEIYKGKKKFLSAYEREININELQTHDNYPGMSFL